MLPKPSALEIQFLQKKIQTKKLPINPWALRQSRPDGVEKVTGEAVFTDDLKFDGMLYARVKRAGIPHGILQSLETEAARELPGVLTVLTAVDIPGEQNHGVVISDWPSLMGLDERVRYVGDAVAIVAAETREIAARALDLIEAKYRVPGCY